MKLNIMLNALENRKIIRIVDSLRRDYDLERLRRVQEKIAAKIVIEDRFKKPINRVTGFDVAYLNDEAVAAAVTMNYNSLQVIEEKIMKGKTLFPYIPTFLSFREGPLSLIHI